MKFIRQFSEVAMLRLREMYFAKISEQDSSTEAHALPCIHFPSDYLVHTLSLDDDVYLVRNPQHAAWLRNIRTLTMKQYNEAGDTNSNHHQASRLNGAMLPNLSCIDIRVNHYASWDDSSYCMFDFCQHCALPHVLLSSSANRPLSMPSAGNIQLHVRHLSRLG